MLENDLSVDLVIICSFFQDTDPFKNKTDPFSGTDTGTEILQFKTSLRSWPRWIKYQKFHWQQANLDSKPLTYNLVT